ncbi:MAG: hypothetical protein KIT69_03340 [Propionibacteriaceae bacterium]|nr:hypothetical protein [Propionibacteriaceae bacterium]
MTTPLEAAERRRRELASAVKRLRVAVMTDPGRSGELADTLIELVGNRLLAWSFAQAAVDAPESVVLSARILADRGPVGPYTSADDAVRYFTAAAQLAAVQAGLGQVEAAGRTVDALDAWRAQLGRVPLVEQLAPETVVWALIARGRSLLGADVGAANAQAEAALLRLYAERLDADPEFAYLAVAAHLLAADARWAAGQEEPALAHHRLALARYRPVGARPGEKLRPAAAEAALAPLAGLFEPFAQRSEALGDWASGIALRRAWLAELEHLGQPMDSPATIAARAGLAHALTRAGRTIEAAALASDSTEERAPAGPGRPLAWESLPSEQALSARPLSFAATVRLQQDERAAIAEGIAARAEAERAETDLRAKAERAAAAEAAERADAERRAAAQAAAEAARAALARKREAEALAARRTAEEAAAREATDQRRAELAAARKQARVADPEVVRAAEAALPEARQRALELDVDAELSAQAAAHERLADLLRPLAQADPAGYAAELAAALDALVSLRWRLGDPEGSREAARERKTW